jgi:adenylate kinase family enzyme
MRRVVIIGSAGSGKSVLARQLGPILGLPVYHLDALYWKPGWVETPKAEWRAVVQRMVKQGSWIIDGNYRGTLDIRLEAAETIIFLDFPRAVCIWQVFKRRFQYIGRTRPDMALGCSERLNWDFIKWVWDYSRRSRPVVLEKVGRYSVGKRVHILRSGKEIKRFLQDVRNEGAVDPATSTGQ